MNRLMIAESSHDQNMFYGTNFLGHDPFVFVQKGKKRVIVVSSMEYERACQEAHKGILVKTFNEFTARLTPTNNDLLDIAYEVLKSMKVKRCAVPHTFSWHYADRLRKKGVRLDYVCPYYPARLSKVKKEVTEMAAVQRATERALRAALAVLRASKVKGNWIYYKGKKLRSEDLKCVIRNSLTQDGCIDADTIVAGRDDSVSPHNTGSGALRAHAPIILDIFPRSEKKRYFADMTRTVCKGKPSAQLKKMYALVKEAQRRGIAKVKVGVTGHAVHQEVVKCFKEAGMEQYFIHGTGHGVGLDIHEFPRVSTKGPKLKAGMVVTIEPGLYVPGVGGIRIEDMVLVTKTGCKNFTKAPKSFVIP